MSAVIPCLFGTTQGFEIVELAPLPFKMKDLLVAITHGEVELSLDGFCVKILRIKPDNVSYTWIGLYHKAYEMGFSREGGYYGAGVWLSGVTVDARHALDALEDLSLQIRKLALIDHKFQQKLTDIVPQLGISPALSALINSKTPYLRGGISADARNCAFICQPRSAREIVAWAQTDPLAHNFQSVIIAPSSAFPKAGASGHIKQYADITALERALEGDYVARLTKIDGLNKNLQKRMQSLEAELAQRKAEIHSLAQKNAQLEGLTAKARMLAAQDKHGRKGYDDQDEKEELSLGHPSIVAPFTFVMSLLLGIGVFYFFLKDDLIEDAKQEQRAHSQIEISRLEENLKLARSEVEKLQDELSLAKTEPLGSGNQPSLGVDIGQHWPPPHGTDPNPPPQFTRPEPQTGGSKLKGNGPEEGASTGGTAQSDATIEGSNGTVLPAQPVDKLLTTGVLDDDAMADMAREISQDKIVQLNDTEKSILAWIDSGANSSAELQSITGQKRETVVSILTKLIEVGYIEKQRKRYIITKSGIQYLLDKGN